MKYSFNICFRIVFFVWSLSAQAESNLDKVNEFVVAPNLHKEKLLSKNRSKEAIGREIGMVLRRSSSLNGNIAKLQLEISKIQKSFFEVTPKLIDNRQPFKKASKSCLNSSLSTLRMVNKKMASLLVEVRELKNSIESDRCLKKT